LRWVLVWVAVLLFRFSQSEAPAFLTAFSFS
jgi:hypothetical protein